jgi:hypothetical protein
MHRCKSMIAALLLCAGLADGDAAEYPERVRSFLDDAAKLCTEHGGTPRTPDDRTVRLIDVNDDGHDDYVIDYRYLRCEGGNPTVFSELALGKRMEAVPACVGRGLARAQR